MSSQRFSSRSPRDIGSHGGESPWEGKVEPFYPWYFTSMVAITWIPSRREGVRTELFIKRRAMRSTRIGDFA